MSIALDTSASVGLPDSGAGNHAFTGTITVGTLTNGILLCALNCFDNNDHLGATAVRLDSSSGTLFTQLGSIVVLAGTSTRRAQLFYLLAPSAGSHSIFVESSYANGGAVLSSWSGVDQTNPFGTRVSGTFTGGGAESLTATSPTGGVVVDVLGTQFNDATPTVGGSQTSLGIVAGLAQGSADVVSSSYQVASGSVMMAWGSATESAAIAVALQPASGVAPPAIFHRFTARRR